MDFRLSSCWAGLVGAVFLLAANSGCYSATLFTSSNRFLIFPNPQVQDDGSYQTNTPAYAQAYYEAIDPLNQRSTLGGWLAVNQFNDPAGKQVGVIFGDVRDLGYGRRMTVRQNTDGSVAAVVANYKVSGYTSTNYNHLSVVAAVRNYKTWHIGYNAIEYSAGPGGGTKFAKFYNFSPTGQRNLTVDLDGRGQKAMPGACINCHGGRVDPLTPADPATGKALFPRLENSLSGHRGDTQARLQPFRVNTFDFDTTVGYRRVDQEAKLKEINKIILCTYPIAVAPVSTEDLCRPLIDGTTAGFDEWQGTAAALIKANYGGDGLPNPAYSDVYIPDTWLWYGQSTMYNKVMKEACMTCHMMRGTGNQSDIDFTDFTLSLQGQDPSVTQPNQVNYLDRIKAHVFDRGNMPLAKIVFDRFWSTATYSYSRMASFIKQQFLVQAQTVAVGRPGRPVAVPGPDRVIKSTAKLYAGNSLYSNAYLWTYISGPGTAPTLSSRTSVAPTFTATQDGPYILRLISRRVTSTGTINSAPVDLKIVVESTLPYEPADLRFSDIKTVLQGGAGCTGCHYVQAPGGGLVPPIFYEDYDRNGDSVTDATDDLWFYTELRGRINFTDLAASPLLRKPSGHHHAGGQLTGFDISTDPGNSARADYDRFLNWMVNGAKYQ